MTTILPITLTMAGAAAITNLWLAYRCGQVRLQAKIELGDGGNMALTRRMRAHANFNEYTPIFLILLGLVELASAGTAGTVLWAVGALFIVSRVMHGLGMDRAYPNKLRSVGIMLSFLLTLGLAIYAVYLPHGAAGTITAQGDEVVPAE